MWDSSIGLELVLKVLLLPVAACAIALLSRRRSASVQHLALAGGLTSLVALPLLAMVMPNWAVSTIPGAPVTLARWSSIDTAIEGLSATSQGGATLGSGGLVGSVEVAWIVWFLGTLVVSLRWLTSHLRGRRILRETDVEQSPQLLFALAKISRRLGLRRAVVLLRGGPQQMPFTVGSVRPRIVLPSSAQEWPIERLEMVLAHELSHVLRLDSLSQNVAAIASALYWFHPLVWWMAHRMRAVAECAADDAVLAGGASPPDYAEELVLLAQKYRATAPGSPAVLGGPFEKRIEALLAENRHRVSLGCQKSALALGAALMATMAVSACSSTEASPAAESRETAQTETTFESQAATTSGRQILFDTVIVETRDELVNWEALGSAARGENLSLLSIGNDLQSLEARLRQGEKEGRLTILSSPKMLTVDGERASAQSGLQVPVQTKSEGRISTQFVNATLRLDMTPRIVEDDIVEVHLSLQKRIPRLELAEGGANAPIATTEASSAFRVRLGGTVAIAGMRASGQEGSPDLIAFVTVREIRL